MLDTKLMAEHLLRLVLDQEQMTMSSNLVARRYNFYKVLILIKKNFTLVNNL